jgi:hypothetical protein
MRGYPDLVYYKAMVEIQYTCHHSCQSDESFAYQGANDLTSVTFSLLDTSRAKKLNALRALSALLAYHEDVHIEYCNVAILA